MNENAAESLVAAAMKRGTRDNVTVVTVTLVGEPE